jgi:hypothetical protein
VLLQAMRILLIVSMYSTRSEVWCFAGWGTTKYQIFRDRHPWTVIEQMNKSLEDQDR